MIKNYFKIAFRKIARNKLYAFTNIFGLAIGIAAFLLISMWVYHELSYDRYHANADNIYRLANHGSVSGKQMSFASASGPMGPQMVEDYPEVIEAVRFLHVIDKTFMSYQQEKYFEKGVFFVDENVFRVFSFNLLQGGQDNVLSDPNSIVLSQSSAERYFGDEDPIGKIVSFKDSVDLTVTGIFEDLPSNSHFRFNFLIPLDSRPARQSSSQDWWINFGFHTYLLIQENYEISGLENKLPGFVERHMRNDLNKAGVDISPFLQPLKDIHLYSNLEFEIQANGNINQVYIFFTIAVLILLIASINFINLSTAQFESKSKEVGLRKVIGATKSQVIKQILAESITNVIIALLVSILIVELFETYFQNISGSLIEISLWKNIFYQITIFSVIITIGFFGGFFSASLFARIRPLAAIQNKSTYTRKNRKATLRQLLTVFQFTITFVLITGSIVVWKQIEYMKNKDLGFDKEHIIIVPISSGSLKYKPDLVKAELTSDPNINSVTATSHLPGENANTNLYSFPGETGTTNAIFTLISSERDYLNTFGLTLLEGRTLKEDLRGKNISGNEVILNERALEKLGWDDPIGKKIRWYAGNKEMEIVGIVKDYHFSKLNNHIEPVVIQQFPVTFSYFAIKISPIHISSTIDFIKSTFEKLAPNYPFEYFFFDKTMDELYVAEENFEKLFNLFTLLAIIISCLGLFALTSYTTEKRTKEIGIRKILGANINSILNTITKENILLILLAYFIAVPIAWYSMNLWLQSFAYRTSIGLITFVTAGTIIFLIAVVTVSYQSIKAAKANPVDSLRHE